MSARAGLSRAPARGLGVIAADVNGDGWPDLYVANDGDPNQLWLNQRGTGAFKDDALLAGVAVSRTAGRRAAWAWISATRTATATKTSS